MNEVRCPLSESAAISRDRIAILSAEGVLLYGDFEQCVRTTAWLLRRAGCSTGERVALLMPLSWRYLVLLMSLLRVAAVACLVNPRWPRREMKRRLSEIACRTVVASGRAGDGLAERILRAEDLVGFVAPNAAQMDRIPRLGLDQPATIVFAGRPGRALRPVLHSFGNHYYNARGCNANLRVRSGDRWLLWQPIHEIGGLGVFLRCVLSGATVVLASEGETLVHALQEYEVTHVALSPVQLGEFLDHTPAQKLEHLRAVLLVGGTPTAPQVAAAGARGIKLYGSYGLAEMASQVTTTDAGAPPAAQLSSGKVLPHRELRIAPDGQVLVRGATLFSGYVEGERLVRPVDADGWFATGDYGEIDADGYLTLRRPPDRKRRA